jgi:Domain of unknown function (DUF5071)
MTPQGLVPTSKHDLARAHAAVAAGFPTVAPVARELLAWLQDINWPVARVLAPFLASAGSSIAPHLRDILSNNDYVLTYNIIKYVI